MFQLGMDTVCVCVCGMAELQSGKSTAEGVRSPSSATVTLRTQASRLTPLCRMNIDWRIPQAPSGSKLSIHESVRMAQELGGRGSR